MLDYALYYASLGWNVFPIHSVHDGICSCHDGALCSNKGKHPLTSSGFNSATTDTDLIRQWWNTWNYANIGVATGAKSGFIVIDIDLGGEDSITEPLPQTVCQTTGSGGSHHLFKYPNDGFKYKSSSNLLKKVDSRADGGYIVIAPSKHKSGGEYSWDIAPDEGEISEAPIWWLDLIRVVERDTSLSERPEWNADGELPDQIHEMLEAIKDKADDYDGWLKVGMALHYTDPSADGFNMWDWWSGLSQKYDAQSVRREWNNFSRRGHMTSVPITVDSIYMWAKEAGWIDKWVDHGKQLADHLLKSMQIRQAEKIANADGKKIPVTMPDSVFPKRGLLKDIAEYILETSLYPRQGLALASAVATVGFLASRKYTASNLSSAVYIMAVENTTAGKGYPMEVLESIIIKTGAKNGLGGTLASGSAIESALSENASRIYSIDEIGDFLNRITSEKASSHEAEIKTNFLTLYSKSCPNKFFMGKERANRKDFKPIMIESPSVCLYGTTTGQSFYSSFTSKQVNDGLLGRFLLIDQNDNNPRANNSHSNDKIPDHIIEKAKNIYNFKKEGNLIGVVPTENEEVTWVNVKISTEINDKVSAFRDKIDEIRMSTNNVLMGRTTENALRLSIIYAVSIDPYNPIIDDEAWEWASEFSLWCANTITEKTKENISDSQYEKDLKSLLMIIKKAGKDGITLSDLSRKKTLTSQVKKDILNELNLRGNITTERIPTVGNTTSKIFYCGE